MYYINTRLGFVRDTKFIYSNNKVVFECTPDVRTAKSFLSKQEARYYMETTCEFKGHYCILKPAQGVIYG